MSFPSRNISLWHETKYELASGSVLMGMYDHFFVKSKKKIGRGTGRKREREK